MKEKLVLAFSGGLDTSYCVLYLRECGYDVVTVTVDTGGFDAAELERIASQAKRLGASAHYTIDARQTLFDGYLRYLVYGNVLRGGVYPLSVSAERVCQAVEVVQVARAVGARALAHGSTGAGNDQVRFDVAFGVLAPEMPIVTPIRDQALRREDELAYLAAHGIEFPARAASYSVNQGMWGTSVGGRETLTSWDALPQSAFPGGEIAALPPHTLTLGFERGVPLTLDGERFDPVELISELEAIAAPYGIGRGVHLGDTILGIKGRVGFQASAAHLMIHLHRELEKLVLSAAQQQWKDTLGNVYGNLLHEGRFFDPLARDLEAFLSSSQAHVSGEVRATLYPRAFSIEGVCSPYSLMDAGVANYGETNTLWTGTEARAFAKLYGVAQRLAMNTQRKADAQESAAHGDAA